MGAGEMRVGRWSFLADLVVTLVSPGGTAGRLSAPAKPARRLCEPYCSPYRNPRSEYVLHRFDDLKVETGYPVLCGQQPSAHEYHP